MRIAINGLGRIGRQVLRQIQVEPSLELVGVNDPADAQVLAHLVRHDSVHGRAPFPVRAEGEALVLGDRRVPLSRAPEPALSPFGDLGAQVVLECSGRLDRRAQAAPHLRGSVARVILAAPCPDADATWLPGLGPALPSHASVISAGCASAHALGHLVATLHDAFGLEAGLATAVESYGEDQRVLDLPHPDLRMARAASVSMIPAESQAAACLARALPWTRGRIEVQGLRVPTPDVGIVALNATLSKDADPEALDAAFADRHRAFPGQVELLDEPLVSVDLRGRTASCLLDPFLTRAMTPRFVKVFAWYDNEAAFASRLVDLCLELAR